MARTLDVGLDAAIARAGTSPGWLIEIGTATPLRYSSRGTLTYDGNTWLGGATLTGAGDSGLLSEVRLGLPNADNAASALALTDLLRDVPVTLYAYYGDPGYETEWLGTTWSEIRVTLQSGEADPAGGTDGYAIVEDGTLNNAHYLQQILPNALAEDWYSYTVAAKAAARDYVRMAIRRGDGAFTGVTFNLALGSIAIAADYESSAEISALGDGWHQCRLVFFATSGASSFLAQIIPREVYNSNNYDGTLGATAINVADMALRRGTAAAYAEELATLAIDAVESIEPMRVVLTLATPAQAASHLPDVLIGPPLCRHIPAPGTVIAWSGTTITVEE